MRLAERVQTAQPDRSRRGVAVGEDGLSLRLSDVVISLGSLAAVVYLLLAAWGEKGTAEAIATFSVLAIGAPALRLLYRRFPNVRFLDFLASFWPLPAVGLGHLNLGPIVDAANPRLFDAYLAAADLRLFGLHPSAWLGNFLSPVLTEFLMVCYYSYFLWPTLFGMFLYFGNRRRAFDHYILAIALLFTTNFLLYIAVPAIGPRFFLAHEFAQPLDGLWLTPWLDGLMRTTAFNRDCFPSGHTAGTLLVLSFAYTHVRKFFWVMLPFAVGLILATVAGRFHYAIDLLLAVPMLLAVLSIAGSLAKARPRGVVVPRPAMAWRSLLEV